MAVFTDPNHPIPQMKTQTIHKRVEPSPQKIEDTILELKKSRTENGQRIALLTEQQAEAQREIQRLQNAQRNITSRIEELERQNLERPVNMAPFRFFK